MALDTGKSGPWNAPATSWKEVQRIVVNEGRRKWKRIRSTLGKAQSLPASKVATISADGGHVVHSKKVNVRLALKEHLGDRFQTARDSPIIKGQFFKIWVTQQTQTRLMTFCADGTDIPQT